LPGRFAGLPQGCEGGKGMAQSDFQNHQDLLFVGLL
jgi:hypothetical protein